MSRNACSCPRALSRAIAPATKRSRRSLRRFSSPAATTKAALPILHLHMQAAPCAEAVLIQRNAQPTERHPLLRNPTFCYSAEPFTLRHRRHSWDHCCSARWRREAALTGHSVKIPPCRGHPLAPSKFGWLPLWPPEATRCRENSAVIRNITVAKMAKLNTHHNAATPSYAAVNRYLHKARRTRDRRCHHGREPFACRFETDMLLMPQDDSTAEV